MSIQRSRRSFLSYFLGGAGAAVLGVFGYKKVRWEMQKDLRMDQKARYLQKIKPCSVCKNRPNILLLIADDMGYGDISAFGSSIATPHLDKLAQGGISMRQFYASAPICSPSRAGLLTGRYPIRTRMNDALLKTDSFMGMGHQMLGITDYGISEDEVLLPEILQKRGYKTSLVGKWHLGDYGPYLPNNRGFDSFYGTLRSNDSFPFHLYRDKKIVEKHPVDQAPMTKKYTQEVKRIIRNHGQDQSGRPFFMQMAYNMPHIPLAASKDFLGQSAQGLYGDAVQELDWSVGQIISELKKTGQLDNTLLIFTSDNGPWYQGSAGPLRGRKRHVFEGGFRVPFIAHWTKRLPKGKVLDTPAMNFDIFATALQAAGIEPPQDRMIDGKDMLPVWLGRSKKLHKEFYFFWRRKLWAMRRGHWKYHRKHEVGDINPNPWPHNTFKGPYLFRLDRDLDESYSVLDHKPDIGQDMAQMMNNFEKSLAQNPRGWL